MAGRAPRPDVLPIAIGAVVAALIAVGVVGGVTTSAAVAGPPVWLPQRADTAAPPVAEAFVAPNDVEHDAAGRLVVADLAANGVLRRGADGTWETIAPFGTEARAMWNPSAVQALPDGRFVVAEAGRRTVAVLDGGAVSRIPAPPTRRAVSELAVVGSTVWAAAPGSGALWTADVRTGDWSAVDGPWTDPGGVAVTPDGGALVVSDAQADDVWRVDRAGGVPTSLGFPQTAPVRLLGVAVGDDGSVFVVDNTGGRVWALEGSDWSVALDAAPDGSSLANPTAVSVHAGTEMAVADYNRRRVVTATREGAVAPAPVPSASDTSVPTSVPTSAPTTGPEPESTAAPTTAPAPAPAPDPTTAPEPTTAPVPQPTTAPTTPSVPAPTTLPEPTATATAPITPTAPTAPTGSAAPEAPSTTPTPTSTPFATPSDAPAPGGSLAATGASVALPMVAAVVALALGTVLLVRTSRRNRAQRVDGSRPAGRRPTR